MKWFKAFLLFFLASSAGCASVMEKNGDLLVMLSVNKQELQVGEKPEFSVKIKNQTGKSVKVLDVGERDDLRDAYSEIVIKPISNSSELWYMISDPGPITNEDFVILNEGESLNFETSDLQVDTGRLEPGVYNAYVVYTPDPNTAWDNKYKSNRVTFEVIEDTGAPNSIE